MNTPSVGMICGTALMIAGIHFNQEGITHVGFVALLLSGVFALINHLLVD